MAEVKSPSTKDLIFLITGLYVPKSPPASADTGQAYWLKEAAANEERTLRDSELNVDWFSSPGAAWDAVRFRAWLMALLFGEIAGHKSDFVAISEPLLASKDVLRTEFKHDMKGATDNIKAALQTRDGRPLTLFNTLSVGISRHVIKKKEVFMFGAGMRRRARFWKTESVAIQADVEFFVPFYEIPNSKAPEGTYHTYAINAGIALSHSDGSTLAIDPETNKELIAVRFNLRSSFGTSWEEDSQQLETYFDRPDVKIQKRIRDNAQSPPSDWQLFNDWQAFIKGFCESVDGRQLLNVPIGPLLLEKVKDASSLKDIFLSQTKDDVKTALEEAQKEFEESMALLDNLYAPEKPEQDGAGPSAGQRKLGHLLESLGFMTSKGRPDSEYTLNIAEELTVWDVVNRIFAELDGHPLWMSGANPKTNKEKRIALTLASQRSATEANKNYFGLAGLLYNLPIKTVPPDKEDEDEVQDDGPRIAVSKDNFVKDKIFLEEDDEDEDEEAKPKPELEDDLRSTVEVFLHLGKWFSDETLDDNWYKRLLPLATKQPKPRVPIPGIRLLPFKQTSQTQTSGAQKANFTYTFRADLVSLGIDIKGATKDGLKFLQGFAGHFGLGAVEIRLALSISPENVHKEWFERFSIGIGVKLKDLRLSLGPKNEEEKKKRERKEDGGDDLMYEIEDILSDEWLAELAPEKVKPAQPKVKTRLSARKKDKFSISFGYLTPLTKDSKGTLDVQLYDHKGIRGKLALIPIDRSAGPLYLRQIGIGLKGVENLELNNGLPDSAQLTVSLTGGLRLPIFELGLIGAKLIFQLNDASALQLELDGLDVSLKLGSVVISGSFLKAGVEYAGMLTVDFPKASFSAIGFYGSLRVFHMGSDAEILKELDEGKVHRRFKDKLREHKITPTAGNPIKRGSGKGEWYLYADDLTRFSVIDVDDKLNVVRNEKTFFVYAMLNAASGCGPTFGPLQFTGIALGYGYNRRLKVPPIEKVARFPLVRMVMGDGGYQDDGKSIERQLGKPLEDPISMLEKLNEYVVAEAGQQFGCAGVRFTVGGIIDCFALVVVQWADKDIELSMLGLARFRHPRDVKATPICYVEMQMLMSFKPREGTFQLQALLTKNCWIFNQHCKLTGGFALFIWFGGEHKGDWVITFGGYHPRFVRPAHYPIVPRLGLSWHVDNNLTIKGGLYLAITPSCGMLGARMEASFHSGRVSAWFTVYLDVIVNWQPLYFEADIGMTLRVHLSLMLTSLKLTLGVSIHLWGPPVGGIVHIDLAVISFDIDFGEPRPKPELVTSWQQFCQNFLNMTESETSTGTNPVKAAPIVQPNLAGGRQNLNSIPNSYRKQPETKRDDELWKVRADELELAAATVVPVTTLNVGTVKTNSPPEGVQERSFSGQSILVSKPLAIETKKLLRTNKNTRAQKLSVHPMGKALDSTLNVTIVKDDVAATGPIELSAWTIEEETSALPAALWDPAKPNLRPSEPSAKLIPDCITGIRKLKPPRGKLGNSAMPPPIKWHQLEAGVVPRSATSQEIPVASRTRDIQPVMVEKQDNQLRVVAALAAAGFTLTWQPPAPAEVRFRELQADPLAGAVAA